MANARTDTMAKETRINSQASTISRKSAEDQKPQDTHEDHAQRSSDDDPRQGNDVEKQENGKPASKDEQDPNVVGFDGPDDPQNPQNWSALKKWRVVISLSMMTFTCTFASSIFSTATMPTSKEFGVSEEVMVLGVALFVLGFAWGPIVWGPFSETFGRKPPLFFGFFAFAVFNIPVAVAQNLQQIFVCRFFGGFFASAALAIIGGVIADMFGPIERGVAMSVFSSATFIGPAMGPILGGFITMSHLGWRWTQWLTLIMAALFGSIGFLAAPETFEPVLLQRKAKRLRYETRNWAIHAPADEKKIELKEIATKVIFRPIKMLALEPILVLVTLYMSLIYGIIYGFFEAFPITFQQERGLNMGVGALPFLAVLIGVTIGCFIIGSHANMRFRRRLKDDDASVPEERLIPMIAGGVFLPLGLFWFAWTSSPSINLWPQIIACVPIGIGINLIFVQGLTYILDVYKINANSALSANTFFRSWIGAGFPMFATPMFRNLGIPWGMSLLAFLCVALFPVPILFYIFGARIRKLSKFSPE